MPSSLRGRLALLFALGAAVLVAGASSLIYAILNGELQGAIDSGLRARADDIVAEVRSGQVALPREEAFAQILSPTGRLIDTSTDIGAAPPVLSAAELAQVGRGEVLLDRRTPEMPGLGRRARLLARSVTTTGGPVFVVVGASLDAVTRGRHGLLLAFAIAGPALVGVLSAGGWLLAGAALRPVERMTEEADEISLAEAGRRLLQPGGDDEIAHLARTLNAMLDRIEATFARERTFLDDASHELRTPVSILRAELELALLHAEDGPAMQRAMGSALEEAERLSRLCEDLLVLAREAAGRLPLCRQPVDLRELIDQSASRLAKDGLPETHSGGRSVRAAVDPARFEQVLANLLVNARRFARHRVWIEVDREQDEAVVTVADDGPGFPPGLLPVAFDRFTRADPVRHHQDGAGAGLGLAIAAAVVRAHGGTIELGNGPPLGGAVVTVRIPALDGD
jgi:signal transduction histidine kinase